MSRMKPVVWIFCSSAFGRFGSATSCVTTPWSPKIDVVVAGLGAGARRADRARALAVERVAAGDEEQVDVRRGEAGVRGRDRQAAREDVDVDARVAVDLVVAAEAEDRVVARAAREVVARLAAEDRVVARAAVGRDADASAGRCRSRCRRRSRRARSRRSRRCRRGGTGCRARTSTRRPRSRASGTVVNGLNGLSPNSWPSTVAGLPLYQRPSCDVSP